VSYPLRFRSEISGDITAACEWYEGRRTGHSQKFIIELQETLAMRATSHPIRDVHD
jgi:hypothetical protein